MMEQDGTAKIQELAKKFRVSAETIRRDLELLQDRGTIQRICGGAMLMPIRNNEFAEPTASISGRQNKIAIGQAAAALIEDGQKLFISSGYTCLEVAKSSPLSSAMGRASMSARSRMHLPGLPTVADTP